MFKDYLDMLPEGMYCVLQKGTNEVKQRFYKKNELLKKQTDGQVNLFFTPNSFGYRYDKEKKKPTLKRDRQHLTQLCSLYVDIDLKDSSYDEPPTKEMVISYAENHIFGSEIAEPTMIVSSGNGIHMYWQIKPESWKKIDQWEKVQKYLYEIFKHFGADIKVSKDPVRVLRIPGTVNVKEYGKKNCELLSYQSVRYELDQLIEEYDIPVKAEIVPFKKESNKQEENNSNNDTKKIIAFNSNAALCSLTKKRLRDLETLLLRYWDKPKGGNRENILFLYRYNQLCLLQNESEALSATLELNQRLHNPLKEKEVIRATKSADKYYHGNKLNWTNQTYVEFLQITDTQARTLCTLLTTNVKRERNEIHYQNKKMAQKAIYRAKTGKPKKDKVYERQLRVMECLETGYNVQQICTLLSISKSTCYRDIEEIKTAEWMQQYQADVACAAENQEATGTAGTVNLVENLNENRKIPKNSSANNYYVPMGLIYEPDNQYKGSQRNTDWSGRKHLRSQEGPGG